MGAVKNEFPDLQERILAMPGKARYDYTPFGEVIGKATTPRLTFLDKEKDKESSLNDLGARKYDALIGRFTSVDPLWEKYLNYTPYHYSLNNPILLKDDDGKKVKLYSETIPWKTLNSSTSWYKALIVYTCLQPRHSYIQVTTDKENVILELGGPTNGSKTGNPKMTKFGALTDNPDRPGQIEHLVIEPKNQKAEYEFENKIIETYKKTIPFLPPYNAQDGPNSNGFARFIIEESGGKIDPLRLNPYEVWQTYNVKGYTTSDKSEEKK